MTARLPALAGTAAIAGMEACWLASILWLVDQRAAGGLLPTAWILAGAVPAFGLRRAARRLGRGRRLGLMTAAWGLWAGVLVKLACFPEEARFDPAGWTAAFQRLAHLQAGSGLLPALLGTSAAAFAAGSRLASVTATAGRVLSEFQFGLPVLGICRGKQQHDKRQDIRKREQSREINQEVPSMRCPYCQHVGSRVLDTTHDNHGGIRRRRECDECHQRFSTLERPILATPLLVKRDGTREEFDREKLSRGIRISCAKRPVSAADIERLVGERTAEIEQRRQELESLYADLFIMHRHNAYFRARTSYDLRDYYTASFARRPPVRSRNASPSTSGPNVTRSRTSSGAVVWLSPSV